MRVHFGLGDSTRVDELRIRWPDGRVEKSLDNLAELHQAQGKYAEAESFYSRSLAIQEEALGPDHPDLLEGLNNLAGLYQDQGDYAQAEPLY